MCLGEISPRGLCFFNKTEKIDEFNYPHILKIQRQKNIFCKYGLNFSLY